MHHNPLPQSNLLMNRFNESIDSVKKCKWLIQISSPQVWIILLMLYCQLQIVFNHIWLHYQKWQKNMTWYDIHYFPFLYSSEYDLLLSSPKVSLADCTIRLCCKTYIYFDRKIVYFTSFSTNLDFVFVFHNL